MTQKGRELWLFVRQDQTTGHPESLTYLGQPEVLTLMTR